MASAHVRSSPLSPLVISRCQTPKLGTAALDRSARPWTFFTAAWRRPSTDKSVRPVAKSKASKAQSPATNDQVTFEAPSLAACSVARGLCAAGHSRKNSHSRTTSRPGPSGITVAESNLPVRFLGGSTWSGFTSLLRFPCCSSDRSGAGRLISSSGFASSQRGSTAPALRRPNRSMSSADGATSTSTHGSRFRVAIPTHIAPRSRKEDATFFWYATAMLSRMRNSADPVRCDVCPVVRPPSCAIKRFASSPAPPKASNTIGENLVLILFKSRSCFSRLTWPWFFADQPTNFEAPVL